MLVEVADEQGLAGCNLQSGKANHVVGGCVRFSAQEAASTKQYNYENS